MRANSVSGGTIREGALFFQTVAAAGALFKRGHYSRGGTIRASTVIEDLKSQMARIVDCVRDHLHVQ